MESPNLYLTLQFAVSVYLVFVPDKHLKIQSSFPSWIEKSNQPKWNLGSSYVSFWACIFSMVLYKKLSLTDSVVFPKVSKGSIVALLLSPSVIPHSLCSGLVEIENIPLNNPQKCWSFLGKFGCKYKWDYCKDEFCFLELQKDYFFWFMKVLKETKFFSQILL